MSGLRLGGAVFVGWLLTACGATQVTTSDSGGGGDGGRGGGGAGASGGAGAQNSPTAGHSGSGNPTPPPAQGATTFSIRAVTPAPAGKQCPVAALTSSIPDLPNNPTESLDADTYLHHVVDGENGTAFKCKVVGTSAFTFEATINTGNQQLIIAEGLLSEARTGTAKLTLTDAREIASSLVSSAPCAVNAKAGPANNFQVKAGSIWASFSCPTVESAPSDLCAADGFFVLENCDQE